MVWKKKFCGSESLILSVDNNSSLLLVFSFSLEFFSVFSQFHNWNEELGKSETIINTLILTTEVTGGVLENSTFSA